MNIQAEKLEIFKMLLETNDTRLVQEVKFLFQCSEKGFWDDLPKHVQEGIKSTQKEARAGLLTPHDEVMKKYVKYL